MKHCWLLLGFFLLSCIPEDVEHEQKQAENKKEEAWVCHNPESPQHGELCEVVIHPLRGKHETCHWVSDGFHTGKGRHVENSFCWLLERADCVVPLEYEWQRKNCHFFN